MTRREVLQLMAAQATAREETELPDLSSVAADLVVPGVVEGRAKAGLRVREMLPEYRGSGVHHALYLPRDWKKGRRYPVIVEYAGNGNYRNKYGDVSTGEVEGSKLGYGMSGGKGFIWVSMPYVDAAHRTNAITWWGDVEATVRYCRDAVRMVCERYGGDASKVVLAGFSRGAIGCNYIGLHDEGIAALWRGFVAYSHYDGVITTWPYVGADRASALERLRRLKGRPVFVCQERSVEATRAYLASTGVAGDFTFQALGFRNHNDAWVLRDVAERRALREWLGRVVRG